MILVILYPAEDDGGSPPNTRCAGMCGASAGCESTDPLGFRVDGKKYTDHPEPHDTHASPNIEFRPSDEARDGRAATGTGMPRLTSQQNSDAKAPAPDEPEQRGSADEPPPF